MKKSKPIFLILIALFTVFNSYSQNQLNLDVDNDLYFNRDFYYSSGIFLSFIKPNEKKTRYSTYKIGQLIYTPSMRYESNPLKYDYPYSGYLFLEYQSKRKTSEKSSFSIGGQIGITGDPSLARGMQNLYHDLVLNLPNLKWEAQLPQAIHINVLGSFYNGFKLDEKINLVTNIYTRIGTYQIMSGLNMGILIGDLSWFNFKEGIINDNNSKSSFFIGTSQELYFFDYKLEGSLFNDDAPLVMPSEKYRNQIELGIKKTFKNFQILTTYNTMSKETIKQRTFRHPFLKISLTFFLH
ncbi:MAG: lipid A-modifier LpxR family protein [Bacteroidota bacterium]